MESGKRSRNFTEREKMLLIEVAKEFVATIDNKKTDGTTVEAKKQSELYKTGAPYYTVDIVETQQLNNMQNSSQEVLGAKEDYMHQLPS
ncbi:unnamed protein product [Parnassius apollo]|uniref:(apollo) hypothetical protein n=1 Tax=Parnassius apollo TaxID=110799 RepID=A0A8S3XKY4_PARAO|nr:unnamed protein product [Parnassius apollo]